MQGTGLIAVKKYLTRTSLLEPIPGPPHVEDHKQSQELQKHAKIYSL